MNRVAAVVLAAGKGKRMTSALPKVLHDFAGLPIIDRVLDAVEPLALEPTVVVVGHQAERVQARLTGRKVTAVLQSEQKGTGHAVRQTEPALAGRADTVLVLVGDVPLLSTETLRALLDQHRSSGARLTLLTACFPDPSGYGRILRNAAGDVEGIVEEKDATGEQKRIQEINSGIMVFEAEALWSHVHDLSRSNAQGEYYLTDLVVTFRQRGLKVAGYCVEDWSEVCGINSPEQLKALERIYLTNRRPS